MRRILRKVAENLPAGEAGELGSLGDTSTLLDPAVVEEIKGGGGVMGVVSFKLDRRVGQMVLLLAA
jgi:hypothetical protein